MSKEMKCEKCINRKECKHCINLKKFRNNINAIMKNSLLQTICIDYKEG